MRILLDILKAQFGFFPHQTLYKIAGFARFILVNGDTDQLAAGGVHRGVLEVFGIHLAQTFEPLHVNFTFSAQAFGQP